MAFKKNISEVKPVSTTAEVKENKVIKTNLPVINQNIALTNAMASKLNTTKTEAAKILASVYSTLRENLLLNGEVVIPGLGKLQVKPVTEKNYPSTLHDRNITYVVGAHNKITWKTTSSLELGEFYLADLKEKEETKF